MKKSKKAGIIAIALILGLVAFFILMYIITNLTKPEQEKWKDTVVAQSDIKAGTYLTEDNVKSYFKTIKVPEDVYTSESVTDINTLIGSTVTLSLLKNEIIKKGSFSVLSEMQQATSDRYKNCTEVSVSIPDLSRILSGRVRAGEVVDFLVTDGDKNTSKIADNVYISHTYDANGVEIYADDTETAVSILTVLINESDKEAFVAGLSSGNVYISRVIVSESDTDQQTVVYGSSASGTSKPIVKDEELKW